MRRFRMGCVRVERQNPYLALRRITLILRALSSGGSTACTHTPPRLLLSVLRGCAGSFLVASKPGLLVPIGGEVV